MCSPSSTATCTARLRDKNDPVRVVGCQLHKIVRTEAHLTALRDGVERVHRVTVLATELLNLHLRRCLERGDPLPDVFSGNWAYQAWVAVSTMNGKVNATLQASHTAQQTLHGNAWTGVSGARAAQLFVLAANQYTTVAATNVWMHLRKRIGAYVNMTFHIDKDELAQMPREARTAAKVRKKRLHWDVCRMDSEARKASDPADAAWVDATRALLGLDTLEWDGKPLEYHAKASPRRFLRPMWELLTRLKAAGWRGFALLPLRRGLTPKHVQVDTKALRDLLGLGASEETKARQRALDEAKKQARRNLNGGEPPPTPPRAKRRTPEELAGEHWEAWDAVCDLSGVLRAELRGLHPRNRRGLAFGFSMTTDGVGCSLKFTLPKASSAEAPAPAVSKGKHTRDGKQKQKAEAAAPSLQRLTKLPERGLWAVDSLKHLARTAAGGASKPKGDAPQDYAAWLEAWLSVQVIGVDPGKAELAVASDPALARGRRKICTVRYTAAQRRAATGPGVYRLALTNAERARDGGAARARIKHQADEYRRAFVRTPPDVAAMTRSLSATDASSASSAEFGAYVAARAAVLSRLLTHYAQLHFRHQRWRHRRESERSVARFVQQLKGVQRDPQKPLMVAWGAWGAIAGRPGQVGNRGRAPCIGVGLMNRVAKELLVVKTPEYHTSKTCCRCGHACGRHAAVEKNRIDDHPRWRAHEIRGLRLCSNSECRRPLNRDANAAVNIGTNLMCLLCDQPLIKEMDDAAAELTAIDVAAAHEEADGAN